MRLIKWIEFSETYWKKATEPLWEFLSHAPEDTKKDLGLMADNVLKFTGLEE